MKKSLIMGLMGVAVLGVRAADESLEYSSNIHAIVKVDTQSTNVLLAVPWTGYKSDGSSDVQLLVDRLVSPKGLTDGDLLLAVGASGAYDSWMLDVEGGIGTWKPATNVEKAKDLTKNLVYDTNGYATIGRGMGLWLVRQEPKAGADWKPVYLYGQYATGQKVVTVTGSAGATNSVLVAHPACKQLVLNGGTDVTWANVNAADMLSIPNGTDAPDYAHWDASKSQWYVTKTEKTARGSVKNTKNYEITVPAGQGFWYSRRAEGNVTITF